MNYRRLSKSGALSVSVLCLSPVLYEIAYGQTQILGTVSGEITDASGGAVPGAQITLTN